MQFGFALALSAILSPPAWSLCEEPHLRLVCAKVLQSQAVAIAKFLHVMHVPGKEVDGYWYEMETGQAFRGDLGQTFGIYEETGSGRATVVWKAGSSYLLFLDPYVKNKDEWVLEGCGNFGPLVHAGDTLKQIEVLSGSHGGIIHVAVGGDWTSYSPPFRAARASARSSESTFSGTTDVRGQANLHVPAGQYTVMAAAERPFNPFELSYANPNKVVAEDGGCARIQFLAEQGK